MQSVAASPYVQDWIGAGVLLLSLAAFGWRVHRGPRRPSHEGVWLYPRARDTIGQVPRRGR